MELDFVKGHMGGNLIIMLNGDQLPAGRELALAVKALGPRYLCAHEAGILYPAGRIKLKLECGAGNAIGGPDITEFFLETGGGKIEAASFTHSLVEVTAVGQAWISEAGFPGPDAR